MFGHTIGALTVAGQGRLTLRPVGFKGETVEVSQAAGDFYSFCGPYRDDGAWARVWACV